MGYRKSNFFERILLIIGLGVIIMGFFFINRVFQSNTALGWEMLQAIFLMGLRTPE